MASANDKRKDGRRLIRPNTYEGDKPDDPLIVAEDSFEYMAICPVCERRVFDASDLSGNPVRVRLKCPHCRNIVKIPISAIQQGSQIT